MTIDQERANTSKFNIRQALSFVGVNVPVDTPLDEYPPYIMGISGGGGEEKARFYCDLDYTLNDISYDSEGKPVATSISIDGFDEELNRPFAMIQPGHLISVALTGEDVIYDSISTLHDEHLPDEIKEGIGDYNELFFVMPTIDCELDHGSL